MKKELIPLFPHLIPKDQQTVETILQCFGERVETVTDGIKDRIETYMMYLQESRPDDWFIWGMRGVSQVATKVTKDQRSIAYLIGIYKMWLSYGFGTYHSLEMGKIKELFVKQHGVEPSEKAQQRLARMISDWGIVFVVSALMHTEQKELADVSIAICDMMEQHMEQEFRPITVRHGK